VEARALAAAVTRATLAGARRFVVPTAGNAGVALAAYAARAGVAARVYAPASTPPTILRQIRSFGADLVLLDGHIGDCGTAARAYALESGAVDVSTLRGPYRIEGEKSLALELAEQLGWTLPHAIVYPTGGGTGLIGMWKGFGELMRAGWSNRMSAGCSSTRAPGGCTAGKPLIFRRFDRMRIAILDPGAGISGDMTLGALLSAGAPAAWLEELPRRLDLRDVRVTVREVTRSGVACTQVEFAIPEQPHGRHVGELVRLVERAPLSDWVKQRAVRAFRLIGEAEGRVHGVAPEQVHLHEVGAVDAVLDIVGGIEGFAQLGVEAVYNLPVAVGNGWVDAAHGRLPVPAPATAILLEGVELAGDPGPVEGEATTPTGAALVRVLSSGAPPARWRMVRSGWGAGQRNPPHYPNALRILVAEQAADAGRGGLPGAGGEDLSH